MPELVLVRETISEIESAFQISTTSMTALWTGPYSRELCIAAEL